MAPAIKWYPPHWTEKGDIGVKAYRRGCRCQGCTNGNTEYYREYRRTHNREYIRGHERWTLKSPTQTEMESAK